MKDLDDLIEYLIVTDQVDENFALKPTCPFCYNPLDKTDDEEFPYYCPKCNKKFNKNLTEYQNTQGMKGRK